MTTTLNLSSLVMRSLVILAISSLFAANVSAKDVKKDPKAALNRDIRRMSKRLDLNEEQQKQFAKTYRAFAKERQQLENKYSHEFAKTLNDRQVQAVMHPRALKQHAMKHHAMKQHARRLHADRRYIHAKHLGRHCVSMRHLDRTQR